MLLEAVWFHIVGTGAKWCHPYIAYEMKGDIFLAELWDLPISWAALSKNPPSEMFGLFDSNGLCVKDRSTILAASELNGNRELLHAASYWLIDRFEKTGLVTRKATVSFLADRRCKSFAPPLHPYLNFSIDEEVKTGKAAITQFCESKKWMVHPSDVVLNDKVTSREAEELFHRALAEIKARTPSGVWNNTRCSHCWMLGEMLPCSECRFACCSACHAILKPLIKEEEIVCVQCVFEEQAQASLSIQKTRPDVNTLC